MELFFLFTYGSQSFLNIFKADGALTQSSENITSLKRILMVTFAVTFLNPHVYIDTVAILGAIGGKLAFSEKIAFLFGALSCSFIWFLDRLWSGIFALILLNAVLGRC